DSPLSPARIGAIAVIDPADQLADVEGLPLGRASLAAIHPVRVPAALAAVGHHHDRLPAAGDALRGALVGPVAVVPEGPVEEVEDGVAPRLLLPVAVRQQDPDVRR